MAWVQCDWKLLGEKFIYELKSFLGYQKILDPRGAQTFEERGVKKKINFMKLEHECVHHKRYNGHCTKQWIKIPKATWTLSILRKRFTWQTSSNNKTSLMKDDVNDEVPNGTPKTLIHYDGVANWDGVLKSSSK